MKYLTTIFSLSLIFALRINAAEIPAPDVVSSALSILPAEWQKYLGGLLMLIGALRLALKPIVTAVHAYCESTGSKVDDEFLARVESSRVWKAALFALDLVASVKPYRGPASATAANPNTPAATPSMGASPASTGFAVGIALAIMALGSGCVRFAQTSPDGTKTTLLGVLQKSTFEGLRASPKTGLSVKSGETSTDVDALRAIAEGAASGAVSGAAKAAK